MEAALSPAPTEDAADPERLSPTSLATPGAEDTEQAAAPEESIYPLTVLRVELVAAALKGASYRSGFSYLLELRQGQIETGAPVDQQLAFAFRRCRDSLGRGLGPASKAEDNTSN